MVRGLALALSAVLSGLLLGAAPPAGARAEGPRITLDGQGGFLSTGAILAARVTGPGLDPAAGWIWSIGGGTLLRGQGTARIGFQVGAPGTLVLTAAADPGSPPAGAAFTVLPPPRAELFAPRRAHVGDSFPVTMPEPFIRAHVWGPVTGAGSAAPSDFRGSAIEVAATASGTIQILGAVEDLAGAQDSAMARVEVVQGDFANPGGVLAEWGRASAARLPSGRVLVVGEDRAASLFDPVGNTWRSAAPLLAAHGRWHGETLLADGKVLVTGGTDGQGGVLASTEIYDPAADRWSAGGEMLQARSGHTATLLRDGTVLVAGGNDGHGGVLAAPERFDPETGHWIRVDPAGPAPPAARCLHTATLLADGTVLIAGGADADGHNLQSAERYDPADAGWGPAAPLRAPRGMHSATLLERDGSVLVAGGWDGDRALASAERYDPRRDTWTDAAPMGTARAAHGAAALAGGRVLVAGGAGEAGALGDAELYDPGNGPGQGDGWSAQAPLLLPRAEPCLVALADGRALVACGRSLGAGLGSPELFSPWGGTWAPAGGGDALARSAFTATLLKDGTVLVAGGSGAAPATASAQRFDPATGSWTATGAPLATARFGHTATLLADGSVLVAGGVDSASRIVSGAERYDPLADRWSDAGAMAEGRALHCAVPLADNQMLVVGGVAGEDFAPTATAELFDGTQWQPAPPMAAARYAHTTTVLADGTVLVAGGYDGSGTALAGAERYDPAAGAWRPPPAPLAIPRAFHTATLLEDGRVLVAGGFADGAATASVERFDPASNTWTPAARMRTPRGNHSATLVNGKVLVTGGIGNGQALAGAELYDPALDTWTEAGTMDAPREGHTATLLQDGATVAVFGGDPLQANLEFWK